MTPLSKICGEKQGNAVKLDPHLSFLKLFQYEEIPCLCTQKKKVVHKLFCVFQTKLNKAVNSQRLPEWIRNVQMIPGFSTIRTWVRICIDSELFQKYFSLQRPSKMLKAVYTKNNGRKNKKLINVIKSGLRDLNMKLKSR